VQGRVVLVTGAAKGIGKEVARQLAELGATVLVSARYADHARTAAEELSPAGDVRALPVDLDVADDASVHQAAAALGRDPGRLDVLINNAAAYVDWSETASGADLSAARQVLEVNLFGAWRLTNALLPLLRQSAPTDRQRLQRRRLPRRPPVRPGQAGWSRGQLRHQQGRPQCPDQHLGRRAGRRAHPGECRVPGPDRHLARCRGHGSASGERGGCLGAVGSHPAR
jgi:NAD(P)-dependent dehydrogenase (short-subunit alcohol dehydrogenase family)